MKIPLNTEYKGRLMPNILVTILGSRSIRQILMVIDTGSEETVLSYKDAIDLQIPAKGMPIKKTVRGISGKLGLSRYARKLIFCLKKEDGTILKLNKEGIHVSSNPIGANVTIIGTDFLKENNFKLFYNPNGEAYLEVENNS